MTERNHNNKNKDPRPPEKEQAHPKHPPYKREHTGWKNLLLREDPDIDQEDDEDYWRWT